MYHFTKKYTEHTDNQAISQLNDVIISTVGTLGKMAVNDIGDCVLSAHVCAVRFVPAIMPEYGLLCIMAALRTVIPPDDGTQTGFSRKLDISVIENLPLMLVGIDYQREVTAKMTALCGTFYSMKDETPDFDMNTDDPVELIKRFESAARQKLREQHKALTEMVKIIKDGNSENDGQMSLFKEDNYAY